MFAARRADQYDSDELNFFRRSYTLDQDKSVIRIGYLADFDRSLTKCTLACIRPASAFQRASVALPGVSTCIREVFAIGRRAFSAAERWISWKEAWVFSFVSFIPPWALAFDPNNLNCSDRKHTPPLSHSAIPSPICSDSD